MPQFLTQQEKKDILLMTLYNIGYNDASPFVAKFCKINVKVI
jgi:hypothetical protein